MANPDLNPGVCDFLLYPMCGPSLWRQQEPPDAGLAGPPPSLQSASQPQSHEAIIWNQGGQRACFCVSIFLDNLFHKCLFSNSSISGPQGFHAAFGWSSVSSPHWLIFSDPSFFISWVCHKVFWGGWKLFSLINMWGIWARLARSLGTYWVSSFGTRGLQPMCQTSYIFVLQNSDSWCS